jgi:hypothetical protein
MRQLTHSRKSYNCGKETQNVTFSFYVLPTFEKCRPNNETEDNTKLSISHLGALQKQFSLYSQTSMSQNVNGL